MALPPFPADRAMSAKTPTETTAEKAISRATLSVSAAVIAFARLARNSSDISKDNLLEPDRQFEYLLLRHA